MQDRRRARPGLLLLLRRLGLTWSSKTSKPPWSSDPTAATPPPSKGKSTSDREGAAAGRTCGKGSGGDGPRSSAWSSRRRGRPCGLACRSLQRVREGRRPVTCPNLAPEWVAAPSARKRPGTRARRRGGGACRGGRRGGAEAAGGRRPASVAQVGLGRALGLRRLPTVAGLVPAAGDGGRWKRQRWGDLHEI